MKFETDDFLFITNANMCSGWEEASPYIGLLTEPKCTEVFVLARRLSSQYEIIGDIHHNPELLDKDQSNEEE